MEAGGFSPPSPYWPRSLFSWPFWPRRRRPGPAGAGQRRSDGIKPEHRLDAEGPRLLRRRRDDHRGGNLQRACHRDRRSVPAHHRWRGPLRAQEEAGCRQAAAPRGVRIRLRDQQAALQLHGGDGRPRQGGNRGVPPQPLGVPAAVLGGRRRGHHQGRRRQRRGPVSLVASPGPQAHGRRPRRVPRRPHRPHHHRPGGPVKSRVRRHVP